MVVERKKISEANIGENCILIASSSIDPSRCNIAKIAIADKARQLCFLLEIKCVGNLFIFWYNKKIKEEF